MKSKSQVISAAVGGLLCMGALGVAAPAHAADKPEMEKCYGVVKAGHNDCESSAHSCAGQSKVSGSGKEWISLPKGVCERLEHGSLKPA